MMERLRKGRRTYFSYLPKDITTMIDRFVFVLNYQVELLGKFVVTEHDYWFFQQSSYSAVTNYAAFCHIREKRGWRRNYLSAVEDSQPIYSVHDELYINGKCYVLWVGILSGKTQLKIALKSQAPRRGMLNVSWSSWTLFRGSRDYLYFIHQHRLYYISIHRPLKLREVNLPPSTDLLTGYGAMYHPRLLLVGKESAYHWDVTYNQLIPAIYSPNRFIQMDAQTGKVYYRACTGPNIYRENNSILLTVPEDEIVVWFVITLDNQVLVMTYYHETKAFQGYIYG